MNFINVLFPVNPIITGLLCCVERRHPKCVQVRSSGSVEEEENMMWGKKKPGVSTTVSLRNCRKK